MKKFVGHLIWAGIAVAGALAFGAIALERGEPINSIWLVAAAACTYLVGFRFYAKFIAAKVMLLDNARATPAERLRNGHDFEPTNKWILFGHHFAAIAGPGPLVGPTLAAQFGYLPGTLWIIVGAVLGGAVQDFIILFASMRRDGKSLGEMAREEIGKVGGITALLTVLLIMVILLAVIALVVVNALRGSPWGTFTIAATMPIAVFMGLYLRYWRPGKVLEVSILGFVLVVASIFGGQAVAHSDALAPWFTLSGMALAVAVIVYGFLASALPVWLLLAPRDYLSTFVKLGVVMMLAIGIVFVRPDLQLPAFTQFVDGTGPIFAGKIFPFCFITIACGAISGFHSLISSGTTPKMIAKEWHAWPVGYGSMLLEGFVAIMAMIAACVLQPGVYFAVNAPAGIVGATPEAAVQTITSWGYPVTADQMESLARDVGEQTLMHRTGGAPSLALGMAHIFARSGGGQAILGFWYHFAIMFEALFILTIIDAGTRVGRFMLQDLLGSVYAPLGRTSWMPGVIGASAAIVLAWGYFLVQGVRDPLGGINSLWPLFGIANQLLAAIALCVATTILLKMHGLKYIWITCVPLVWLVVVTYAAAWQKIFSPVPRIGFLAQAAQLESALASGEIVAARIAETQARIFNERLDAAVCGIFLVLVTTILLDSIRVWVGILRGTRDATIHEAPYVPSALRAEEI
ncbi:MAG: carbon starvation protein A [Bryobacteraceae bacterium]|nr:carbon starvation protein A [Bryobacterales bacterium]MEB2361043.1 carbon starvation protein A [Bryobacterales bacterium]NUN01124.1 carbon starvation protein A [Bryobacteraceae bacterium]